MSEVTTRAMVIDEESNDYLLKLTILSLAQLWINIATCCHGYSKSKQNYSMALQVLLEIVLACPHCLIYRRKKACKDVNHISQNKIWDMILNLSQKGTSYHWIYIDIRSLQVGCNKISPFTSWIKPPFNLCSCIHVQYLINCSKKPRLRWDVI